VISSFPALPASQRRAYAAWLVVCVIWGTTYLGIRIALETIPPLVMPACRWIVAGSLLLAILRARGERLPPVRSWPQLALLGSLLIGVGNGAVVWAEQTVPSGLTALLVAVSPFWMVGIEALMPGGERLTRQGAAGLLIGFCGIVALVWPDLRIDATRGTLLRGIVATQFACIGWAVGSTYARRHGREENVLAAAALQMLFGGLLMAAAATLHHEWDAIRLTPRTLGALAYLTFAGSIAGFSAYAYALKHLPISTVSLYAYANPVIAVALGTLILGEPLEARMAVAAAVVLSGIALVRRQGGRPPQADHG
jgi:drug/metabolite transporter (DMT)-like permease